MGTFIKIWLPVSTFLAVLGLVSLTGLSAQEGSGAGELPAPIGFVEIDGVGRFDIHPISEDMTRNDASRIRYEGSKLRRALAWWHDGGEGGQDRHLRPVRNRRSDPIVSLGGVLPQRRPHGSGKDPISRDPIEWGSFRRQV